MSRNGEARCGLSLSQRCGGRDSWIDSDDHFGRTTAATTEQRKEKNTGGDEEKGRPDHEEALGADPLAVPDKIGNESERVPMREALVLKAIEHHGDMRVTVVAQQIMSHMF